MPKVQELCETIKNTFTREIIYKPLAAVVMLGDFYRSLGMAKGKDKILMQEALAEVKSKLQSSQLQTLWDTIKNMDPDHHSNLSSINKETLDYLKHCLLQDFDIFKHLNDTSIIEVGHDLEFYREALIALIRKHIYENNKLDPFTAKSINYSELEILKEGASEQNSRHIGTFLKECSSLPVENLLKLGSKPEIAKFILLDLNDVPTHLELSKRFSELHSTLRKEVATTLQNQMNTMPLSAQETAFCQNDLPKMQEQMPEFQPVVTDSRVRRDNVVVPPSADRREALLSTAITVGATGLYVVTAVNFPPALAFTMPWTTLSLAACYSAGVGYMTYVSKKLLISSGIIENAHSTTPRP